MSKNAEDCKKQMWNSTIINNRDIILNELGKMQGPQVLQASLPIRKFGKSTNAFHKRSRLPSSIGNVQYCSSALVVIFSAFREVGQRSTEWILMTIKCLCSADMVPLPQFFRQCSLEQEILIGAQLLIGDY